MALDRRCPLPLLAACGALWGFITAKTTITARSGEDVTLCCLFPAQPGMDLRHLTLTWKKEWPGAKPFLIHSYYNGREQLARQAETYRNRTWLDPEGLAVGNVSLTLRHVYTQDEGVYRCYVHSELGRTYEHWEVRVVEYIGVASPVTGLSGRDVTLSCFFPSKPGMDLQQLTITWQKEWVGAEDLVVHSYYYGKDQLAWQAETYRNRTWLDPEGLARGDASLTLRGVHTEDEGIYHCYVHSELGGTMNTTELTVNGTSHILVKKPGAEGNPTGQSYNRSWLLVACLGAWILLVIVVTKLFCPPGCGTYRCRSESHFAGMMDVEDPSPQIQPGPAACSVLHNLTTSLRSDLVAPSPSHKGSGAGSWVSLDSGVARYSKEDAVPQPTWQWPLCSSL